MRAGALNVEDFKVGAAVLFHVHEDLEREKERGGKRARGTDKGGTWWGMKGRRLQQWEMISILLQGLSCFSHPCCGYT